MTTTPDSIELSIDNGNTEQQTENETKMSCMVCRKSKKIRDFGELQPGDHIEKPMFCEWKSPMKHHAIVQSIEMKPRDYSRLSGTRGHKAKVMVIDVPNAGDTFCERYAPFKSGHLAIKSHTLQDKDEINCKKSTIKRVDYRCRRHPHKETLQRAETFVNKDLGKRYNACVRNCEHFSVAMVSGKAKSETSDTEIIEKSTCLQSARCFWLSFHVLMSLLQFSFYYFNFYLYAVYARSNERYNHFFGNTTTNVLKVCYTGSEVRGFTTICDWITFSCLLTVYACAYVCLLCFQRTKQGEVCKQCKVSARIVYTTKVIFFVACEIFNIFIEKHLYEIIEHIDKSPAFTIVAIFLIAFIELVLLLFVIPHVVVKYCLIRRTRNCCMCPSCNWCCTELCCYPWNFDEDSYKYVIHYA